MSSGKRANRTRFTDYQIKVLQEFFENNAYPKDDDLEYLSKLLSLSPRVIVVWFQNARQKARKIYENQPPSDNASTGSQQGHVSSAPANTSGDEDTSRFTRTPGCNYQCKKCLLVFQRYYELIRHQKQHCFKEEDAKRSALAQKAAAQAAADFVGNTQHLNSEDGSNSSFSGNEHRGLTSPICLPTVPDDKVTFEMERRKEMSSDAVNRMLGAASQFLNYPPTSPFGFLHQQAQQQMQQLSQHRSPSRDGEHSDDLEDSASLASSPSSKRKLSEDGDNDEDTAHRDKRLRTAILPEQLDFLFQKYQQESNPSRKMLEQIAGEVGLTKRVVQVWFQNTRAKERKGQIGLTLASPSSLMKPNQSGGFAKRNGEGESEEEHDRPALPESPFTVSEQIASLIPNSASAFNLQSSMRKYYEDTMKRFMNDLNGSNNEKSDHDNSALDLTSSMDDGISDHQDGDSDINRSMDTESINGGLGGGNKRFRTQMSGVQVKMMKGIFEAYKTPTMTECSSLGQEIGLQKRVVQVWFQNARAKEKRAKLQLQQATGGQDTEGLIPTPEDCKLCGFKYSHKYAVQDHIFTKSHLDNLRNAIETGRYDPESPGYSISQTAAVIQAGGAPNRTGSTDTNNSNASLQMLQMATTTSVNNRELLDTMSSHQNSRMLMQV